MASKKGRSASSPAELTAEQARARDIVLTLVVVFSLMAGLFLMAVFFTWRSGSWRGLAWFLNGSGPFSTAAFLLGLIPGAVFGFVDQLGLWTSVWSDDPMTFSNMLAAVLAPWLPEGERTRMAWGNLISDTVGTFCAVMVAQIVSVTSGRDSFPLYSEVLGVALGSLAGIYLPRLATGRA